MRVVMWIDCIGVHSFHKLRRQYMNVFMVNVPIRFIAYINQQMLTATQITIFRPSGFIKSNTLCIHPGGSLGLEMGTHVRKQNRI
jgi:hypothetical protein